MLRGVAAAPIFFGYNRIGILSPTLYMG